MRADSTAKTNGSFLQLKELIVGDEQRELSALQERLAENESSLAALRESLEEKRRQLQDLRDGLDSKERQLAELRGELGDRTGEISGLQKENQDRDSRVTGLRDDLENAQREQAALRDGLEEQGRQLTGLEGGLQDTGTEVAGLGKDLEMKSAEIAALRGDLEDKGSQITGLRKDLDAGVNDRAALRAALDQQERQLAGFREDLDAKDSNVSNLRESLLENESRLTGLRDEFESAQRGQSGLRDTLEDQHRALGELREDLETERQAYDEFRKGIEREQGLLAALKQRLDAHEEYSVERLTADLANALRGRQELGPEAFDDLVAAMQPGTVSAIQRSVSGDKQPLTKALFPIMGPAIRNYVMELFRGMVEELNKTIQNATSVERLKWRAQAKLAGKPYSEYVLLKTRSFRIEEAYLMQRDTGLLLLHCAMNPAEEAHGEADLVSGMFTAIRSFVRDSFARGENAGGNGDPGDTDGEELDRFTFGEREVLIEVGPSLVLAAVARGVPAPSVRDELKRILEDLHAELQPRLDQFSGDTAELEESRPTLREALIENQAESEEKGGGLWRAWAALAIVALGIATWIFFSVREQRHWNRFETALRAEPGIAVTEVKDAGWWRHREVHGVRDPLAADPAAIAGEHLIDLDKTTFAFGLMESLEPGLKAKRDAAAGEERQALLARIDGLVSELESLQSAQARSEADASARIAETSAQAAKATESLVRSLFSDIPGLEIQFTGDAIRFRGDLAADELQVVQSRLEPLKVLGPIDTTGLSNDTGRRLAALLQQIASASIPYRGGTLEPEDPQRFQQLARVMGELNETAAQAGTSYTFTILAHPLIGTNREANRLIETQRAEQVRRRFVDEGFDPGTLDTRLSEDLDRAGQGITVLAVRRLKD